MNRVSMQLVAVDAVVLDTETTGLDAGKVRVVQIGAVRLAGGQRAGTGFASLIDPGEPIPPATTLIHGIDDAAVQGAPRFPEAWARFQAYRAGALVIGHTIGFDLAVLKREHGLAGLAFAPPPCLDTRLLAEIALPGLAGYALDQVAARLELPPQPGRRHDAAADAEMTASVLLALVPLLRARGIRTVGEAAEACRALSGVLDQFARAGWLEPRALDGEGAGALARIDAYPFRHRVRDLMSAPVLGAAPDITIAAAVRLMTERRVSSLYLGAAPLDPARTGILTERDVMRALSRDGAEALGAPAVSIASSPVACVPADAFVYRAIGRMDRLKLRHLGVTDEAGLIIGALSARDLLRVRASEALALGDAIDAAEDAAALATAFARLPAVAGRLVDEGVPARDVAAVISREIGAVTRRAAELAERRMAEEGAGSRPAAYAVLVLGSGGRGESLLAPDQDNALVLDACDDPAADDWFARLATHMADILDVAGVPYCKGGVMAKNPAFRGTLATWRERIGAWTARTSPADLLAVDIFYDFRLVAGDGRLALALRDEARQAAAAAPMLAKLLAADIDHFSPPIGLLRGIKTENGRVDLKIGGLFPIVAAARSLALRHGIDARGTAERLAALRDLKLGLESDLESLAAAHETIMAALLRQQLADIAAGRRPSNRVDPAILSRDGQARLKAALGSLSNIGTVVKELLFPG